MRRLFIIHRWEATPRDDWYLWLKEKLEKDFEVEVLKMPDTMHPKIDKWISLLRDKTGKADKNTFFVGHSIGCQTILRYLESLGKNVKVGGVILVTPWLTLTPEATNGVEKIAEPWTNTPIDWEKIKIHCNKFLALFSDNDPFVPLENIDIFKKNLNAE